MGWGFRRRLKLGPVNINLSKSGVGYSIGVPGLRIGKTAKGKSYGSAGIKGTGIYQRKYSSTARRTSSAGQRTAANHGAAIFAVRWAMAAIRFDQSKLQQVLAGLTADQRAIFDTEYAREFLNPQKFSKASIFGGWAGVDRGLLGDHGLAVLKLLTLGGYGLWWLLDIALVQNKVEQHNLVTAFALLAALNLLPPASVVGIGKTDFGKRWIGARYSELETIVSNARQSGDFVMAIRAAHEVYSWLPELAGMGFDLSNSESLNKGPALMAISGDHDGITGLHAILKSLPELCRWIPTTETAKEDADLVDAILEMVSANPGMKQKALYGHCGDGRRIATLAASLEQGKRLRRIYDGKTYLLTATVPEFFSVNQTVLPS